MKSWANISECGRYRYRLSRRWGDRQFVCFIMLNPSTADAEQDDPTIRKCIKFAENWGFDGIEVLSLFAWRSTDPKVLRRVDDPFGPDNRLHWKSVLCDPKCGMIVAAWGRGGQIFNRGQHVLRTALHGMDVYAFRIGKSGEPDHPLYQPYSRELVKI